MGDKRIEDFIEGINKLCNDTGLSLAPNCILYDGDKPVAEIRKDNVKKDYYPRYIHEDIIK